MLLTVASITAAILAPVTVSSQDSAAEPAYQSENPAFANPYAEGGTRGTPAAATPAITDTARHGALLGNPDAPVTLQIYADYQ
jgi:protein-disulfide isomerase